MNRPEISKLRNTFLVVAAILYHLSSRQKKQTPKKESGTTP